MNKVVYYSKTKHTKRLANAVGKALGLSAESIEEFNISEPIDILFVGASIYGGGIDEKLKEFLTKLNSAQVKNVAVFCSSATQASSKEQVKSILEPKGINVLDEEFHCKGAFLLLNFGRPNKDDLQDAEEFARDISGKYK